MLRSTKKTIVRARRLRRKMTLPEVLLWQHLRQRPGGVKYRRQHPAGPFVLDFYCEAARLCIEVDGAFHDRGDAPRFDQARDRWLAAAGIRTVRIPAKDVLSDFDAVLRFIALEVSTEPLHHSATPSGPPPLQGGF